MSSLSGILLFLLFISSFALSNELNWLILTKPYSHNGIKLVPKGSESFFIEEGEVVVDPNEGYEGAAALAAELVRSPFLLQQFHRADLRNIKASLGDLSERFQQGANQLMVQAGLITANLWRNHEPKVIYHPDSAESVWTFAPLPFNVLAICEDEGTFYLHENGMAFKVEEGEFYTKASEADIPFGIDTEGNLVLHFGGTPKKIPLAKITYEGVNFGSVD